MVQRNKPAIEEDIAELGVQRKRTRGGSTRKAKVLRGEPKPETKERLEHEHTISPITAKTANQRRALKYFDEGRQLHVLCGAAGSGKSFLAAYYAAKAWRAGKVDQIILIRSLVSTGVSCGSLPGTIQQKLGPALGPIISHLEEFLGAATVKYCLEKEIIKFLPLDFIRGSSWKNKWVIAEEVQNMSVQEAMSLVTRIGEGSTLAITGDGFQNDMKSRQNGIDFLEAVVKKYSANESPLEDECVMEFRGNVGITHFTNDDVVRSGLTKAFVKAFNLEV